MCCFTRPLTWEEKILVFKKQTNKQKEENPTIKLCSPVFPSSATNIKYQISRATSVSKYSNHPRQRKVCLTPGGMLAQASISPPIRPLAWQAPAGSPHARAPPSVRSHYFFELKYFLRGQTISWEIILYHTAPHQDSRVKTYLVPLKYFWKSSMLCLLSHI